MRELYLTIQETAEYLSLSESRVQQLIQQKRIRTIFDGERVLINQEQFNRHFEQLEKYKKRVEEERQEPLPEDWDAKDED